MNINSITNRGGLLFLEMSPLLKNTVQEVQKIQEIHNINPPLQGFLPFMLQSHLVVVRTLPVVETMEVLRKLRNTILCHHRQVLVICPNPLLVAIKQQVATFLLLKDRLKQAVEAE